MRRLRAAATWLDARPRVLDAVAVLVVLAGLAIRLRGVTAPSLWLDEGFTVAFARQPWDVVLGMHGAYDAHPPLYYAIVKAVTTVWPELVAARFLSVVAGTLTLAVVYRLVGVLGVGGRWGGRPAALLACALAAISPLLVYYSQEGRQYAVTGLAVALAWLALAAFHRRPGRRWAMLYGVALATSVWLDYSAIYALAPQLALLVVVARRHRRSSVPLLVAGAAAVVVYLPWLPNLLGTVHALGTQRGSYLDATPTAIRDALLSIVGLAGQGIYYAGTIASPWERWSGLHWVLGAPAIAALVLGGLALARARFALAVALALVAGTVAVAILASQVSPGFAARTVSYAGLGWAILLAAAVTGGGRSTSRRVAGLLAVAATVAISLASLQSVWHAEKQDWRGWAAGVAQAATFRDPVITYPGIAPTFVDLYARGVLAGPHLALNDVPDLGPVASLVAGRQVAWVAGSGDPAGLAAALRDAGLVRVSRGTFSWALSIDLWERADAPPGVQVTIPGIESRGVAAPGGVPGWTWPADRGSVVPGALGPALTLSNPDGHEIAAALRLPAVPGHLYSLALEARSTLVDGPTRAYLVCEGADGSLLTVAPDGGGANVTADGAWHPVLLGVLCPARTVSLRIDLRSTGVGDLGLRSVRLFEAAP